MEPNKLFKEYQERLMTIFVFFDKLCRDNDIKYTALDGTLLGAVRHKGMIPWDGDIDVALTPKEFEKLKKAFDNYEGRYYFNYIPGHFYKANGRKHNFPTLTAKIVDKKCNSDIYGIDVFTIDFFGDDIKKAEKTLKLYNRYNKLMRYTTSFHIPENYHDGSFNLKRKVAFFLYPVLYPLSKLLSPIIERSYLKFRNKRLDNNQENCKYFSIQPYIGRFGITENTFLDNGYMDVPFEDTKIMVASGYEVYLKGTYGDYMKLPPDDKRVPYPSEETLLDCVFED